MMWLGKSLHYNKAHVIITHVPQVIARTGKGLFYQSEEVVEATHSKFETFWKRYKVLDVESEQHGQTSKFVGMSSRLQYQKHIMGKNKSIVESLNLSSFTIFVLTSH